MHIAEELDLTREAAAGSRSALAELLSISEGAARVLFCRALAALRGAVGGDHAAP